MQIAMKMNSIIPDRIYSQTGASQRRILLVLLTAVGMLALAGAGNVMAQKDSALFWKISRNGETAGYLLGTIHSEDPRVLDFTVEFIETLSANQVFAMEMVPDLPTLQRLTEFMQYQDGTTLEARAGPDRYERLQTALSAYQVPADWISRMKIWAAMMTLSIPPPETGFFMDFSLSLRAAGAGLRVVGLETLEQQLSFLEDMPMEQQLGLLDQALSEYEKVAEIHQQMVDSYLQGDLLALEAQAEEQFGNLDLAAKEYFMEQGINVRNRRMADSLTVLLQTDQVFAAVGALHLPGETGLIELLRSRGYQLTPLPLPLSDAGQASGPGSLQ